MSSQDLDVMYVQNPALGTVLLWRFTCGYYSNENRPVPFPLLFVVLPIVFLPRFVQRDKRAPKKPAVYQRFRRNLFSGKLNDSIHYVNNTAIQMRELTLEAFNIAVEANLMSLSTENATVSPLTTAIRKYVPKGDCKIMLSAAEKLGAWCSELTLLEVGKWLKVRF